MARQKRVIDGQLLFMVAVLAVLGAIAWWKGGPQLVREGFANGVAVLLRLGLIVAVALLVAGVAETLVPRQWVESSLGEGSGWRGIALATAAGAITPAGPYVAMPIAAVLIRSGAALGPVVAFLTAWSLLALHRLFAWEVPMLGLPFAAWRWAICLALPFLAGTIAALLARGARTP